MYVVIDREEYQQNKESQGYEVSLDCNGNLVFIKWVTGTYEKQQS